MTVSEGSKHIPLYPTLASYIPKPLHLLDCTCPVLPRPPIHLLQTLGCTFLQTPEILHHLHPSHPHQVVSNHLSPGTTRRNMLKTIPYMVKKCFPSSHRLVKPGRMLCGNKSSGRSNPQPARQPVPLSTFGGMGKQALCKTLWS